MGWPFIGKSGTPTSGFIWGMSADERILKAAEKAGKRDSKNPPPNGTWPNYLRTLVSDVQAETEQKAEAFSEHFAVPRQTSEACLDDWREEDRQALAQAIHDMVDLLDDYDGKLIKAHRVRQGVQARYERGLTDGLGYAYWTAPPLMLQDPVPGRRAELQRLAARANRRLNPPGREGYTADDDPFPQPKSLCAWSRVEKALNEGDASTSESSDEQPRSGGTHA